jgi:hypothetical protein
MQNQRLTLILSRLKLKVRDNGLLQDLSDKYTNYIQYCDIPNNETIKIRSGTKVKESDP